MGRGPMVQGLEGSVRDFGLPFKGKGKLWLDCFPNSPKDGS